MPINFLLALYLVWFKMVPAYMFSRGVETLGIDGYLTRELLTRGELMVESYASTTVNIATELEFFSRMCSLQSLEMLESEHHLVTALSAESWPGVLQRIQKHIRG